jgi:molybdenum cofactor cytidylyltransferase
MNDPLRIGVLLAAGRGTRMGRTKQLVPWPTAQGEKPLVSAAFDAIRPISDAMVVVLGHEADLVAAALGERQFHRAMSDPAAPMFESIRAGLRTAQKIDAQATVVLHPGDHPEVAPHTLSELAAWSLQRPGMVIIPQYAGRGGHPVLVPTNICQILIDADCSGGLGQFWLDNPELCVRVPVEDAGVTRDIDTPGDFSGVERKSF